MREIKFRAWNKYGMNNPLSLKEMSEFDCGTEGCGKTVWPEETIFMQFTGLLDKNGIEIYEGDIVNSGLGEIFYCSKSAMFKVRWHDKIFKNVRGNSPEYHNGERLFQNSHIAWEIIGNIYQNSNLLK